ncbi:UDP-N-acetylglucosamine 4,6-dehydratase [archaeon BMS3Abin16]|nr:UDP-N-acetylglucosamine 4,6-dehydratase [archaeon BMS3Abin16]
MKNTFADKNILVTGGTGSVGREIVKALLPYKPKVVRIFDSSEGALFALQQELGDHEEVRYFLGDIRDEGRLQRAMQEVDIVFHTAALKHVSLCEYNPFEAVQTNVLGTQNVIEAALANDVEKVIFTSSDKAVNPSNTMGATKLVAEKLMVSANYYRGRQRTAFASVRFGNVIGTSGSVIPLFIEQIKNDMPLTVTHTEMTRFFISLEEALGLLFQATVLAQGGETFIMKMPVMRVIDLAHVLYDEHSTRYEDVAKKRKVKIIGTKPGEKLYEELMTDNEAPRAIETKDLFIIMPNIKEELSHFDTKKYASLKKTELGEYRSDKVESLSQQDIKKLLIKSGIL